MKHIHYLYIGALAFLIACSSEERITTTNGNDRSSDAIELSAGIVEGNAKATTRTGAEDNHTFPGHQIFSDEELLCGGFCNVPDGLDRQAA